MDLSRAGFWSILGEDGGGRCDQNPNRYSHIATLLLIAPWIAYIYPYIMNKREDFWKLVIGAVLSYSLVLFNFNMQNFLDVIKIRGFLNWCPHTLPCYDFALYRKKIHDQLWRLLVINLGWKSGLFRISFQSTHNTGNTLYTYLLMDLCNF